MSAHNTHTHIHTMKAHAILAHWKEKEQDGERKEERKQGGKSGTLASKAPNCDVVARVLYT